MAGTKMVTMRLSEGLADVLKAVADTNDRTFTAQVERYVRDALEPDEMTWTQWIARLRADGAIVPDSPSEADLDPDTVFVRHGKCFRLDAQRMVMKVDRR